jgi:putative PIN family toxin of toxin-antitoxin system
MRKLKTQSAKSEPRKLKVTVDTNIFVSGLISDRGAAAKLIDQWNNKAFELVLSQEVLDEYWKVLYEMKHKLNWEVAKRFLDVLKSDCIWVKPSIKLTICRDSSDNKFLECAVEANADCIVTQNVKHFPKEHNGVEVVKISKFLKKLGV